MTASLPPATKVALSTVDLILSLSKGEGVAPQPPLARPRPSTSSGPAEDAVLTQSVTLGGEDDYGKAMLSSAEFQEMATRSTAIKGKFILSINDVPVIRELFVEFKLEPVELNYTVAGGKSVRPARVLIVTN